MKAKKSKEELDKKVKDIQEFFGEQPADLMSLQKFFKDKFNPDIIKVGSKAIYDLHFLFNISSEIRKKFKKDPIQPITVTYIRSGVIFFTYDKHPEYPEEWTLYDADASKWLYLSEIKLSELWKNKEFLKEKDFNEWYIQVHSFKVDEKFTKLINDIE